MAHAASTYRAVETVGRHETDNTGDHYTITMICYGDKREPKVRANSVSGLSCLGGNCGLLNLTPIAPR